MKSNLFERLSQTKNMRRTARRAISGMFVIGKGKTTMDPTGLLMNKQNSRILNVNADDFQRMLKMNNFSEEEGIAYLECMSSIPHTNLLFTGEVMSGKPHPLPQYPQTTNEETVKIPEIMLYPNGWPYSWERVNDGENVPPTYWTKDFREYTSPRARSYPKVKDKKKYVMAPYEELTSYEKLLADFVVFLRNNKNADRVHLWTQGTFNDNGNRLNPLQVANKLYSDVVKIRRVDNSYAMSLIKEYWTRDITTTEDHYSRCSMLDQPRRVPIVGWRSCNFGIRDFKQRFPQLVPSTRLGKISGMSREVLIKTRDIERYLNYSGFVKLREVTEKEIETLDFAYQLVDGGFYLAVVPSAGCYVVDNPEIFNGYGSVCTSYHSSYGRGRDVQSLMKEYRRYEDTNVASSGHMIASSLMYRCHVLTYLNEVYTNYMTRSSIYNLPVVEPTSGLYHTKQEYQNAIIDIRELIRSGVMHKYALDNFNIISKFVDKLM